MDIKLIKTVNGEDIVTEIVEDISSDTHIGIRNPLRCVHLVDGSTGIFPWVLNDDHTDVFNLPKEHVLFMADPASNLVDVYYERFGLLMVAPELTGLEL